MGEQAGRRVDVQQGSVVVAHLHGGQSIAGNFAVSLDKMVQHDESVLFPPIRVQSNVDLWKSRNDAVKAFLDATPGEWLLFIDDDMGFGPDMASRLKASASPTKRPVVGALAFAYRRYEVSDEQASRFIVKPTIYRFIEKADEVGFAALDDYERDTLVRVDGTGAAALLIHRGILEGLREEIGDHWFSPITLPKGPGGRTQFGEDLSFCFRLLVSGVPVHVDTSVKTSHRKPVDLDEWYFEHQPTRLVEPEFVVVGTGRSGTGFISTALTSVGVHCGHEGWWNVHGVHAPALVGDASWIATNYLDDYTGRVFHQVRHPLKVIRSMIGNELFMAPDERPEWVVPFEEERGRWAGYDPGDAPEVKALRVVRHWWETAEKHAEQTWRLEEFTPGLLVELAAKAGKSVPLPYARAVLDELGTGTNKHPDGPLLEWTDLPDGDDKAAVEALAAGFGYEF